MNSILTTYLEMASDPQKRTQSHKTVPSAHTHIIHKPVLSPGHQQLCFWHTAHRVEVPKYLCVFWVTHRAAHGTQTETSLYQLGEDVMKDTGEPPGARRENVQGQGGTRSSHGLSEWTHIWHLHLWPSWKLSKPHTIRVLWRLPHIDRWGHEVHFQLFSLLMRLGSGGGCWELQLVVMAALYHELTSPRGRPGAH